MKQQLDYKLIALHPYEEYSSLCALWHLVKSSIVSTDLIYIYKL